MARNGYSLPPRVNGEIQGEILVTIDRVLWHQELHSVKHGFRPVRKDGITCARISWWGHEGNGILFRPEVVNHEEELKDCSALLNSAGGTIQGSHHNTVVFPLHCSPKLLTQYMRDTRTLVIDVFHFDHTDREDLRREVRKVKLRSQWASRKAPAPKRPVGHAILDMLPMTEVLTTQRKPGMDKYLAVVDGGVVLGIIHARVVVDFFHTDVSSPRNDLVLNPAPNSIQPSTEGSRGGLVDNNLVTQLLNKGLALRKAITSELDDSTLSLARPEYSPDRDLKDYQNRLAGIGGLPLTPEGKVSNKTVSSKTQGVEEEDTGLVDLLLNEGDDDPNLIAGLFFQKFTSEADLPPAPSSVSFPEGNHHVKNDNGYNTYSRE